MSIVLFATFCLGYILPELLPGKVNFSGKRLPKSFEDCELFENRCFAKSTSITLINGQFTPLQETEFDLNSSGKSENGNLYVSSDDQRFGTIKAEIVDEGRFRVMIPYCSNKSMRIILFTNDYSTSIRLPILTDKVLTKVR